MPLSEHVYRVAVAFKITDWVEQQICIKFCVKFEHSSTETIWMNQKAAAMATGDWQIHLNTVPAHASRLFRSFLWNIRSPRWLSPSYGPDLMPWDFWLFPKLKSPLKGKGFQTIHEIYENTTGQLMAIGRTVWGPKVPTLQGTEVSLSCVQCFLYLMSTSINSTPHYKDHTPWPSGSTPEMQGWFDYLQIN